MRLIDADALLESLIKTPRYFDLKFDIDNAPTIGDVQVYHARGSKILGKEAECIIDEANAYRGEEMTREEAIEWMGRIKDRYIHGGDEGFDNKRKEAIDMAIEALQAKPVKHGEWGKGYRKTANGVDFLVLSCSECDNADPQMNYYNYCPNCGAKMR